MKIILDAMGSDDRPEPELQASVQAAEEQNVEIILVGNENVLKPRVESLNPKKLPVHIAHAPEAIDMSDHIEDVRKKRQNSMRVGMELLKQGQGDAFVTAGNTGMVMYTAKKVLDVIPGVIRPGLTTLFPVKGGHCVVLDIGANAECRPEFMVQFALMGNIYARKMLGISQPRVGLLSNGEEAGKGNELVKGAYPLLQSLPIHFIGNVEGKELFGGAADVVITDGFTGNVLLKSSEAVAKMITEILKEGIKNSPSLRVKLGGFLLKPGLKSMFKVMDPAEVGAAPLLGIDGLTFVGHGRSNARAMVSAVRVAKQAVEAGLLPGLRQSIQESLSAMPLAAEGNS